MGIKDFILNTLFPKTCINCGAENNYICQDCFALIDFLPLGPYRTKSILDGLFSAVSYNNFIIKKIIAQFKYEPFIKDLADVLSFLIIHHLNSEGGVFLLKSEDMVLTAIPTSEKRRRFRGFNPPEEIAKKLSLSLQIPLADNVLLKIKDNLPQVELSKEERKKNVKGAFVFNKNKKDVIEGKTILLVDDVFTTGSTMEEAATILKKSGAKKVFGITVAKE